MDPRNEDQGPEQAFAPTGELRPEDTAPLAPAGESRPPLPPDLAGSPSAPAAPLPPDLGARRDAAPAAGWGPRPPAFDPAGAGMPPEGPPPPYSPPYGWAWPSGGAEPPAEPPRRRRRLGVVSTVAAVALVAGGLGAGLGVAFGTGPSSNAGSSPSGSIAPLPRSSETSISSAGGARSVGAITAAVEPSVVDINVNVASPAGYQQQQAAGTGMIVTSSGEVLTNNHVVEDATSIHIVVAHHGTYTGRVLGVDPTRDVALVQIVNPPKNLPYVTLGDSATVQVGDSVVAIGNAYGLGGTPSVATGIVSALGRTITASDQSATSAVETLHNLIQTSAQIAAGDSGGPLVNTRGEVIGMDTAAASGEGGTLGFAIPINTARQIVLQIEHGTTTGGVIIGESPFLGIEEQPTTGLGNSGLGGFGGFGGFGGLPGFGNSGSTQSVSGVALYDVIQGSPAQRAGLSAGDTITAVDGTRTPNWTALTKIIEARKPGQSVTVSYVDTNGATHTVTITLAGLPK